MGLFIFWIVMMFLGAWIGSGKNRSGEGFAWAFFFGPLGVLIIALRSEHFDYVCPMCKLGIRQGATICPHCRSGPGKE